jgi:hypothetical protein
MAPPNGDQKQRIMDLSPIYLWENRAIYCHTAGCNTPLAIKYFWQAAIAAGLPLQI